MTSLLGTIGTRLVPALLTAAGVVLITAGLLSYTNPAAAGTEPVASAVVETLAPSEAFASPSPSASPSASPTPGSSGATAPSATPLGTPPASIVPDPTKKPGRAIATRVVVPALKIDLPVVRGNDGYPLCNVAMYLHTAKSAAKDAFGQPGEGRATYLYAHARDGMFGPIYELAIQKKTPKRMLGMVVEVYTSDNKRYLYEIREYRLHVTNLDGPLSATKEELWLQTSEGPKGTPGKTQLRAFPISVSDADPAEANPKAKPVACG
ncbi:MAG TPA: hypothetical protein VFW02_04570 [Candidatus Limnocylindrales bacterium]|nr:hypothetical protein [Candidatus Limnocylindrales bacterium]